MQCYHHHHGQKIEFLMCFSYINIPLDSWFVKKYQKYDSCKEIFLFLNFLKKWMNGMFWEITNISRLQFPGIVFYPFLMIIKNKHTPKGFLSDIEIDIGIYWQGRAEEEDDSKPQTSFCQLSPIQRARRRKTRLYLSKAIMLLGSSVLLSVGGGSKRVSSCLLFQGST